MYVINVINIVRHRGFLGCCLLPFCIDGLKDVEHMCPNCGKVCGVCRRF